VNGLCGIRRISGDKRGDDSFSRASKRKEFNCPSDPVVYTDATSL